MEPTVLYELLGQARVENKAVQLYGGNNLDTLKFIIEPEHQVENKSGNIIYVDNRLIDLNFIAMALIVPNNEDRVKELERIKQEVYRPSKSRRVEDVYPLKPEGKEYRS